MAETSADQYAPAVNDVERYMDSKGGAATYKPGREPHDAGEQTDEERRHAAEVGNEARKQSKRRGRKGDDQA